MKTLHFDMTDNASIAFSITAVVIGITCISIGYQITASHVAMSCTEERTMITKLDAIATLQQEIIEKDTAAKVEKP